MASSVTQIWYSLRLSEEDFQLVIRTLRELTEAASLEELTGGAMKMNQVQLEGILEVWRTWLQLSSRKGDWITQARNKRFQNFEDLQGMNLYLEEIPEEHKKSASDWFADGILLPRVSRNELPRENFTLTGSDFQFSRNKGEFKYKIESSITPFSGWDYKDLRQWGHSPSILKMYSEYVCHVLKQCALKLASGQVKFHFLLCNCMEITPLLPPDRKYDRVTTSNIADYVPLTTILDTFEPLLNPTNPSSAIVTEFLNWTEYTNVQKEAVKQAAFMQRGNSFRRKVLEDTKDPSIANSRAYQSFVEYRDHSAEFIQFLRANLLICEVPGGRSSKRTWKSLAYHDGLIARNFLRCQNRVFPAKWMLNCRRVTILTGFERAVEWIAIPK